jgi:hypothetical protein
MRVGGWDNGGNGSVEAREEEVRLRWWEGGMGGDVRLVGGGGEDVRPHLLRGLGAHVGVGQLRDRQGHVRLDVDQKKSLRRSGRDNATP